MNRKGFTLIELIAVITILGIIAIITVPIMYNSIKNAKEKMYEEQKLRIVDVAKKYALENESVIRTDLEENYTQVITLTELKNNNYLEQKDIINPIDEEVMDGCILVKYTVSNDKFNYSYSDTCSFGNYYDNSANLYLYHSKISANNTTIGDMFADTDGVSIDSSYLSTPITIYDDAYGYLFDKDDIPLTFYAGMVIESEDVSALLEIYQALEKAALIEGNEDYNESLSHYDIYIDLTSNVMALGIDFVKEFEMTGIEEIQKNQVDTIERACNSEQFNTIDDCTNVILLNHLKLDN